MAIVDPVELPDETNNVSQDANTTNHNNTTVAALKRDNKGNKGKKKKNDMDAVEEQNVGGDKQGPGSSPDNNKSDEKL